MVELIPFADHLRINARILTTEFDQRVDTYRVRQIREGGYGAKSSSWPLWTDFAVATVAASGAAYSIAQAADAPDANEMRDEDMQATARETWNLLTALFSGGAAASTGSGIYGVSRCKSEVYSEHHMDQIVESEGVTRSDVAENCSLELVYPNASTRIVRTDACGQAALVLDPEPDRYFPLRNVFTVIGCSSTTGHVVEATLENLIFLPEAARERIETRVAEVHKNGRMMTEAIEAYQALQEDAARDESAVIPARLRRQMAVEAWVEYQTSVARYHNDLPTDPHGIVANRMDYPEVLRR